MPLQTPQCGPLRCRVPRRAASVVTVATTLGVLAALSVTACAGSSGVPPSDDGDPPSDIEWTVLADGASRASALAYGTAAYQLLDLYVPAGEGPFPLVVWVHGGYWSTGSRTELPSYYRRPLTNAGYAVATVDHRLAASGANPHPTQVQDLLRAVSWMSTHRDTLRIDPDAVVLTGDSSGGHLSMLAATADGLAATTVGTELPPIRGVITFAAPTDLTYVMQWAPFGEQAVRLLMGCGSDPWCDPGPAEPWPYLDPGDPPLLMFTSSSDPFVPPYHADRMLSVCGAVGVADITSVVLNGVDHDRVKEFAPMDTILSWIAERLPAEPPPVTTSTPDTTEPSEPDPSVPDGH